MRLLFRGQVPKDLNYPEVIEDALEVDPHASRAVLSDGASESFDSKSWAQLLTKAFIRSTSLTPDWLEEIVREYNTLYDLSTLSWSKFAAFERGSFATLLGVEESSAHDSIKILSVGDCLAVFLDGAEFIDSFPYNNPSQFKNRPELFCTNPIHNGFLDKLDFYARHSLSWSVDLAEHPVVLCMTDALGEWALKMGQEGDPQWETLLSITETAHLEMIVIEEREKRRMRVDDVTLVSLAFKG
mgnify:CR=1 FL=1